MILDEKFERSKLIDFSNRPTNAAVYVWYHRSNHWDWSWFANWIIRPRRTNLFQLHGHKTSKSHCVFQLFTLLIFTFLQELLFEMFSVHFRKSAKIISKHIHGKPNVYWQNMRLDVAAFICSEKKERATTSRNISNSRGKISRQFFQFPLSETHQKWRYSPEWLETWIHRWKVYSGQ